MATKSNHTIVREWRSPRRTGIAITSTGLMLRKRVAGGRWTRTYPKVGLSLAQIAEALESQGWERTVNRPAMRGEDWIPNPVEKQAARNRAASKHRETAQEKRAAQEAAEAEVLPDGEETEVTRDVMVAAMRYVTASLKAKRPPIAGPLAYVYDMARFHGGATGGYLGTAIGAEFHLPKDYPYREALDAVADACARIVFGSDMHAANAWRKALYG